MKGRMEKMPSVTNARVAKVQKKSFERKAWKKVINAGSLIAVSTVTVPLARKSATTGHNKPASGARRIANNPISATTKAAAQMKTPGDKSPFPLAGEGRGGGFLARGSLTAITVISSVMTRMTATTP